VEGLEFSPDFPYLDLRTSPCVKANQRECKDGPPQNRLRCMGTNLPIANGGWGVPTEGVNT